MPNGSVGSTSPAFSGVLNGVEDHPKIDTLEQTHSGIESPVYSAEIDEAMAAAEKQRRQADKSVVAAEMEAAEAKAMQ